MEYGVQIQKSYEAMEMESYKICVGTCELCENCIRRVRYSMRVEGYATALFTVGFVGMFMGAGVMGALVVIMSLVIAWTPSILEHYRILGFRTA